MNPYYGKSGFGAATINTDIWARVTGSLGQKLVAVQPPVIPSAASRSINPQAVAPVVAAVTSANRVPHALGAFLKRRFNEYRHLPPGNGIIRDRNSLRRTPL